MCAGALVQSRIARVVYGARDEKAGAVGSLWDVVRDRGSTTAPRSSTVCCEECCAELLTAFFRER